MNGNRVKGMLISNNSNCGKLAEQLGISQSSLTNRLTGLVEFKLSEIEKIKSLYNLSNDEIVNIFFTD